MKNLKQTCVILAILTSILSLSTGCGKSPESAAQEVCNCLSKTTSSKSASEMAGNGAECDEMVKKYQDKFTGKDLNTFTRKMTECILK